MRQVQGGIKIVDLPLQLQRELEAPYADSPTGWAVFTPTALRHLQPPNTHSVKGGVGGAVLLRRGKLSVTVHWGLPCSFTDNLEK